MAEPGNIRPISELFGKGVDALNPAELEAYLNPLDPSRSITANFLRILGLNPFNPFAARSGAGAARLGRQQGLNQQLGGEYQDAASQGSEQNIRSILSNMVGRVSNPFSGGYNDFTSRLADAQAKATRGESLPTMAQGLVDETKDPNSLIGLMRLFGESEINPLGSATYKSGLNTQAQNFADFAGAPDQTKSLLDYILGRTGVRGVATAGTTSTGYPPALANRDLTAPETSIMGGEEIPNVAPIYARGHVSPSMMMPPRNSGFPSGDIPTDPSVNQGDDDILQMIMKFLGILAASGPGGDLGVSKISSRPSSSGSGSSWLTNLLADFGGR